MFYENLKQEILQLLAKNQYQTALNLIDKELDVPYIPRDFEVFLHTKRNEAQRYLNQNQKQSIPTIGPNEIKMMLQTSDSATHLIAIEAFDKINIRLLDRSINDFLLRRDVPNDIKSLVLISLQKQALNQVFNVWHGTKILEINPQHLQIKKLTYFNQQVTRKLETIFFRHNQSLTDLAIKIALLFLLDFFPQDFYFSVADVTAMALKRAGKMLNENITWKQIQALFPFDIKIAMTIFKYQLPTLD